MKIGILLASDFTEGNGANARIKTYAKGLKELGNQVNLLFLHASSFNNTWINVKTEGVWEGIYYKFLNGNCIRPYSLLGKVWDSLKALVKSTTFLIRNSKTFDVLYIYSPKPHQFLHILLLCKMLRIPVIIEMTELYSKLYEEKPQNLPTKLLSFLHKWFEKNLSKFCDHLVVISQKLYEYYKTQFTPAKLTIIPILVDFSRFKHLNGHPHKPKRVGYLGSFGNKDDVPGIIEAFSKAKSHLPELKLRLMGHSYDPNSIKEKLAKNKLNGSVEYLGQVQYKEIPDLLHECDLLIVNRTSSPYSHFGFPTKLGEYLATGKPTVVTKVGNIPDYLKTNFDTIFIEPENPDKLAETIIKRYRNYNYYDEIGVRGNETSHYYFDYKKHVKRLQNLIHSISYKGYKA